MKHAAVIGWPIEHSRSPLIHGYWLEKYNIEGTYKKLAVAPDRLSEFLAALEVNGLEGCNVTVPHKEAAFAVAGIKDASAVAVGAANTIWREGTRIACANTDTYGFMRHLELSAPSWSRHAGPISILGAGGAARAIIFGFLQAGASDILVFNRSRKRAEVLARHFGSKVKVFNWEQRTAASKNAGVIVNTTSLGLKGQGSPEIDFRGVQPDCVVADIVYVPLETAFLKAARANGLVTVDGLGMLLHQAVPGFEKWFGRRPEVTAELRAKIVADIEAA